MPAKVASAKKPRVKSPTPERGSAWGSNPKFTIAQAAAALDLPIRTVYDHINGRRLGHVRLGSQFFVRQSHIDTFIADGNREAV